MIEFNDSLIKNPKLYSIVIPIPSIKGNINKILNECFSQVSFNNNGPRAIDNNVKINGTDQINHKPCIIHLIINFTKKSIIFYYFFIKKNIGKKK